MSECLRQQRYCTLYARWRDELNNPAVTPLTVDELAELENLMRPIAGVTLEPWPQTSAALNEISRRACLAAKIDLEKWLRGEVNYPNDLVRAAAERRFNRQFPLISLLIEELVDHECLVPEKEVASRLRRLMGSNC